PWLGTKGETIDVPVTFGKHEPTYHPASEKVYQAISDILDEVAALFPGPIIHIGGDEVKFNEWRESDEVRKLMEKENLATMADVQIYFTNRIAKIVQSKGRNAMGWNEILGEDLHGFLSDGQTAKSAALDPATIIHFWKGDPALAKRAIRAGHRIVNSLHSETYLDYQYAGLPLTRAYRFEPIIAGLTAEEEKQIIGIGCQMWGEWIPSVERMEHQVYPRIAAYAEVGWTDRERKDENSFLRRLRPLQDRWDAIGIHHAREQAAIFQASDFFNFTRIDSWSPERVPAEFASVDFSTDGKITGEGSYEIAWVYQSGVHAIEIQEIALCSGDEVLASDRRNAFSGAQLRDVVFTLNVPPSAKEKSDLVLRAKIRGSDGTDSHGEIRINGPL
ncbi:MAG: family 20 glycosylhydrolase, partial [Luteolibacter sp.]